MSRAAACRIHRITAAITMLAILFWIFFQINKGGPFRAINPFGADPYDAVGSFAVQLALLVGALTYARALRLRAETAAQAPKAQLILRGNGVVLSAVGVTLLVDALALILHAPPPSYWATVLGAEVKVMALLTLGGCVALIALFRGLRPPAPPRELTPSDALDDLWAPVRLAAARLGGVLPPGFVRWTAEVNSDHVFAHAAWSDPRRHPWRFAILLGLFSGALLIVAQAREGPPPDLSTALLLILIFLGAETAALLAGFALLGGYLGLRPALRARSGPA